jgi:hypothetical protein
MASVIAETRLQATDDFRFEAPPGNGRFLSQPTMKLLRQPQTDHPMSRPPLHQGKASNASPKGNPDNQAGNGGKGDGHGDTTGQTWNAIDLRAASARSDTLLIMCRAECTEAAPKISPTTI